MLVRVALYECELWCVCHIHNRQQPDDLVMELVDLYRKDFELFGYDWNAQNGVVCGDRDGCGPDVSCI